MTEIHSPPNEMLRIDELYLFISVDEHGEGVCAAPLGGDGSMMPLVAADRTRLDQLMPWAQMIAKMTGKKIKLIKFTERTVIKEIGLDA
jgi:hypothetical protein